MTKITEELLISNGYYRQEPFYCEDVIEYTDKSGRIVFSNTSNMEGREWGMHVDNDFMETIGFLDVQYVCQANKFLELLDMEGFMLSPDYRPKREYYGN